jgi:hypothetical protein
LDISQNRLGYLSVPEGWESKKSNKGGYQIFKPPRGEWGKDAPPDAKPEGIIAVANAIKDMGALTKFMFSGDENSESVTMETTMTVADFSGGGLGASGAIMLSAFLPKCT